LIQAIAEAEGLANNVPEGKNFRDVIIFITFNNIFISLVKKRVARWLVS